MLKSKSGNYTTNAEEQANACGGPLVGSTAADYPSRHLTRTTVGYCGGSWLAEHPWMTRAYTVHLAGPTERNPRCERQANKHEVE